MDLQPIRQSLDSMEIDDQEKKSVVSFLVKKSRFMEVLRCHALKFIIFLKE